MDRELSEALTLRLPVVAHATVSEAECWGCIVAVVEGTTVELRCKECGAVAGVIEFDLLKGLLKLDSATVVCPHCHRLNAFPGFTDVQVYVCNNCGQGVEPEPEGEGDLEGLGWVVRVLRRSPPESPGAP